MTAPAKSRAENLVARLARHAFLALWSYANPRGKKGKELCDVLAVCDPDVVIFSVKEVSVGQTGNVRIDWERWHRSAIEESAKQIYGAERWLRTATHVIRTDGASGVTLPDLSRRRVHRVAVALGSDGSVPLYMGDLGKGFVHVLSEDSLDVVLAELDTIDDLARYLSAKEQAVAAGTRVIFQGSEKDLLAMYLTDGRRLPTGHDVLVVGDDIWEHFVNRSEYQAKKEADRGSYVWDRIVDRLSEDVLHGRMEFGSELDQNERAIRVMAREDRFARRIVGKAFKEFFDLARANTVRARIVRSPSKIVYVFLATPHGYPREVRVAELDNRCFVARGLHSDAPTVVGIATEQYEAGKGFSLDVIHLHIPQWTAAHQQHVQQMQAALGYFAKPQESRLSEDEYPHVAEGEPSV